MEELMIRLIRDSGKGRMSWLALIGVMAILLAACSPQASASPSTAASQPEESQSEESQPEESQPEADLDPIPMRIGVILPQTGGLSSIIDALEEPLRMGAEEMNAASEGLVTIDFTDSGTDATIASQNIDQYLTGDHNAIIGPAASGVANAVWDKVNTSEMVMCSGSSTGSVFSGEEYNPFHVRTAPSDDIQGPLLGNLILEDGYTDVAVVWRSDDYGVGFGESVASSITDAGGNVVIEEGYDQDLDSFTDLAQSIVASGAEAVAMITFAEGAQLRLDLQSAGFDGQIYVADGFVDNVTVDDLDAALLEGLRGTYPAVAPSSGEATFPDRFAEFAPEAPTVFSAHMYDCLAVLVLAAQVAQSSDPADYNAEIIGVTRDGEKCSLIAECLEMVWAGIDIDYDGASGALDFSPNGEPGVGIYNVIEFNAEGTTENLDEIQGELP
ncbi:MAG TPA: ABC transporter substrate-binding protein [Acidimicrobiia bacterium]|nr:ABC transporter substrate-binding protein [Acidimicrobiia bacterium]